MDVLFPVLPFADVERPAIGVSLLQAQLKRIGVSSAIRYFTIDLAEWIGLDLYNWLTQCREQPAMGTTAPAGTLIGEWFFADLVFPGEIPPEDEYIAKFLAPEPASQEIIAEILKSRRVRHEFITYCVREIQLHAPKVVGFTSAFHQTCACLAVAMRLKHGINPPIIIFGGPNCAGEMGLQMIRSFRWIDYVCTGEGDEVVPLFLQRLLCKRDPHPLPGILKEGETQELTLPAPVRNMDTLPLPDYCDYFGRLRVSPIAHRLSPRLLIETARGCWWGEKQHCTFCGLNGDTMVYRSKSPGRVIQELSYLCQTYELNRIDCVDNILDTRYIRTVFPELIRNGPKVELFYETKSNLRLEQLRTLWRGGVRSIQPGIESFSNDVLRLMHKGSTGLQNIQLLRWCDEFGMQVAWNILYGFPDESPSEYERMTKLVPLLAHLQPPAFCQQFRMDRFSPLFANSQQFDFVDRRPMAAYSYVYPLKRPELERLAYFFDFGYADGRDPTEYTRGLMYEVARWAELHRKTWRPQLDLLQAGSVLLVNDTRPCAVKPTHILSGPMAKIYVLCDTAQTVHGLAQKLDNILDELELRAMLEQLLTLGLVVEMEDHYLSLAVFRNRATEDEVISPAALEAAS